MKWSGLTLIPNATEPSQGVFTLKQADVVQQIVGANSTLILFSHPPL